MFPRSLWSKPAPFPFPPDSAREQYRMLLHRIGHPLNGKSPISRIGITSARPAEGVTTVAVHLAAMAARTERRRVLLVDGNRARPALHCRFGLPLAPGLTEVERGTVSLCEALRPTDVADLAVLCAGDEPGEEADGNSLANSLLSLGPEYGRVIFDLPSADQGSALLELARGLEGVVLVIQAEQTGREEVRRARDLLAVSGVPVIGALLNQTREHVPRWLCRQH